MRDKRRTRRRVVSDRRAADEARTADWVVANEAGTADWVLVNEAGWGFPHRGVAILAGIIVGARTLAWLTGRLAAAVGRRLRQGRG